MAYTQIVAGDRLPAVEQRTTSHPDGFHLEVLAGRYVVICPYLNSADPLARSALAAIDRHRHLFDGVFATVVGVSASASDQAQAVLRDAPPGVVAMWDLDTTVCRQFGVLPLARGAAGQPSPAQRSWIVVDPTQHVLATFSFDAADPEHQRVFDLLGRLPPPDRFGQMDIPPPVLVLPNVFEPELCQRLIGLYDADGGRETGIARGDDAEVLDPRFKRRRDFTITDPSLIGMLNARLARRVLPDIKRLFFMDVEFVERQIIGCYDTGDGGRFEPHRDNNVGPTAHRRYAVSINLNDGFEGGELSFPEYRRAGMKAPAGWAVIFPCAILHAVTPMRSGRRYAYLPFLFDQAGQKIRDDFAAGVTAPAAV